jgi:uncharacterized metal-binding protein
MKVNIGKYKKDNNSRKKVKVEFDGEDFYSLDSTLAIIILPALKQFKDIKYKYVLDKETEDGMMTDILDKMIYSFEIYAKHENCGMYWEKSEKADKFFEGLELFGKYYTSLWY